MQASSRVKTVLLYLGSHPWPFRHARVLRTSVMLTALTQEGITPEHGKNLSGFSSPPRPFLCLYLLRRGQGRVCQANQYSKPWCSMEFWETSQGPSWVSFGVSAARKLWIRIGSNWLQQPKWPADIFIDLCHLRWKVWQLLGSICHILPGFKDYFTKGIPALFKRARMKLYYSAVQLLSPTAQNAAFNILMVYWLLLEENSEKFTMKEQHLALFIYNHRVSSNFPLKDEAKVAVAISYWCKGWLNMLSQFLKSDCSKLI